MALETLAQAIDRLTAAGYTDDFRAESDGLHAVYGGCVHQPEELMIEEVVRFEGITNPDDEAILFALRCSDGMKGTYTTAYGPNMPAADAEMARRLNAAHRR